MQRVEETEWIILTSVVMLEMIVLLSYFLNPILFFYYNILPQDRTAVESVLIFISSLTYEPSIAITLVGWI